MDRRKTITRSARSAEIDLGEANEKILEQMSEEEKVKMFDVFKLFDKDNSGSISAKVNIIIT